MGDILYQRVIGTTRHIGWKGTVISVIGTAGDYVVEWDNGSVSWVHPWEVSRY